MALLSEAIVIHSFLAVTSEASPYSVGMNHILCKCTKALHYLAVAHWQ